MTVKFIKSWTLCLGQSLIALALAISLSQAAAQEAPKKMLVYLGFGLSEELFNPQGIKLEDELGKAFQTSLNAAKAYQVIAFTRTHPSVKRALAEGSLKSQMLWPPFTGMSDGRPKAVALGRLLRGDLALAGVIDKFDFDSAKKTSRLVVSVELYDVKSAKLLGLLGLTAEASGETEVEAARAAIARFAADAVPQAVGLLATPPKKEPPKNP